ncbi:MAG: hypothetical protein GX318_03205, partial [Clostridia bacterium]|nr:hypothetical protein [Clostridia bacterium]
MFRGTKRFLMVLLAMLLIVMNIGTACFAEGSQFIAIGVTSDAPEKIIKTIYAGGDYSAILYDDGTVATFGNNSNGQLGLGTDENVNVPTNIKGLTDVKTLSAGATRVFATRKDGSIWAWGKNYNGELRDGT